jgi:glycosyltransferase involved in cell wall biosynthesis
MKLGIVIPWFGRDLKGGAEQQAWQIAMRLGRRGHDVEVLTTCCRSHQDDWTTNHLPAGVSKEPEGFAVRRFPVDPRERAAFDRVCAQLLGLDRAVLKPGISPVDSHAAEIFARELIKSKKLMDFLGQRRADYDWFLFLPYLYGPTLEGVSIVGERAILQPCLHDESYAYLPQVAAAFYGARQVFFNSEGELELALRLFGPGISTKSRVVGEGVEAPESVHHDGPNGCSGLSPHKRYLLYLGRKDPGKNVPLLLRAFERFRAVRPNSTLGLVLAGPGDAGTLTQPGAIDVGPVTNETKEELLRHCLALVQPSENESFSRVMMEAWLRGKPAAVHADCGATAIPVQKSRAGWLARSEEDWAALFVELDRTPEIELRRRGENGQRYAAVEADWETVMNRYESAFSISSPPATSISVNSRKSVAAINQFLPNLSYGDAISNEAIWIRDQIRGLGLRSEIFVQYVGPMVASECRVFSPEALHESDAAIYHHSIGTDITPHIIEYRGPKCLIYHNITPGEFFEAYRPAFAKILYRGREDLAGLAASFEHSVGDSAFNAAELAQCGFSRPGVLPLAVNPAKWSFLPDQTLMKQLQDGRTNILFVGRFAPNKRQDDLIVAFTHYLAHDPDARLVLVGKPEQEDPYVTHLRDLIAAHGLADSVLLPGTVADPQLEAYYRTAHLFWSMSEHEGFCVPLIEAMWFDVPVFAFKGSAVPETLADAALVFTSKEDMVLLAATAHAMVSDSETRQKLIAAQRKRRINFLPEKVIPVLVEILGNLCPAVKSLRSQPMFVRE